MNYLIGEKFFDPEISTDRLLVISSRIVGEIVAVMIEGTENDLSPQCWPYYEQYAEWMVQAENHFNRNTAIEKLQWVWNFVYRYSGYTVTEVRPYRGGYLITYADQLTLSKTGQIYRSEVAAVNDIVNPFDVLEYKCAFRRDRLGVNEVERLAYVVRKLFWIRDEWSVHYLLCKTRALGPLAPGYINLSRFDLVRPKKEAQLVFAKGI